MKPETGLFLERAHHCLADAAKLMALGMFRVAVREAYLAALHGAQAAIFEDAGRVVKTHSGVRTEFARLAGGYGGRESGFTKFLADAYQWKETADYGPETAEATFDRARPDEAVAGSARLVEAVERIISARTS